MPQFHTDDYFHIGHTHLTSGKPCQDYAFSGICGKTAFAVVSDGCSTGRHTDIGSRVVALSAVSAIQRYSRESKITPESLENNTISTGIVEAQRYTMRSAREMLGLELADMLATSNLACITPNGGFVNMYGDGVIAKVHSNGFVELTSYEWNNNTPLYLAYTENANARLGFIRAHGGDLNAQALKSERWLYNPENSATDLQAQEFLTLGEGIGGVLKNISSEEMTELAFVAVFTDGVMQIDGIDWKNAVTRLLAFKNINGEFAKRRMIRFIKETKEGGKKGPLDDIAYAVIRVAPDGPGGQHGN